MTVRSAHDAIVRLRPVAELLQVRLLAAQLNIVLGIVPVAIFKGDGALPDFLEKNPMGGVPVLKTNSGEYLPESNAILTFLAEGTRYLPREGMAHAQVIRWLMFEQRYVQASIGRLRYWTLTGKLDQFARDVATAQALGNRALDVLDGELSRRPFVADIHFCVQPRRRRCQVRSFRKAESDKMVRIGKNLRV